MVDARVAEFRDQTRRRIEGTLSEEKFRPLRLQNGLYLQLHAYMLRVAVPYGTLNAAQMRVLGDIADKYDRGYGHFTTRQNIQYNWIKLEDTPDILADLAKVEMHAIQTSGNCIRNISADQYAGAAGRDHRPAPLCRTAAPVVELPPRILALPRKFKICVIGADTDRAAMRCTTSASRWRNEAGEVVRLSMSAAAWAARRSSRPCCAPRAAEQLITLRSLPARLQPLWPPRQQVQGAHQDPGPRTGSGGIQRQVEEEFAHLQRSIEPPLAELERIKAHFADPAFETGLADDLDLSNPGSPLGDQHRRAQGARLCHRHHQPEACGRHSGRCHRRPDARHGRSGRRLQLRRTAHHPRPEHRAAPCPQGRPLRPVAGAGAAGLASANLDHITDIIACPGLDYCSLANARSIPLAQKLSERFAANGKEAAIGELKLKISGCINACGHHHAGHIGILGVDRKGRENYQLLLRRQRGGRHLHRPHHRPRL
jgi:sulfite reductase (NADPH) hemoprotein beta-component